MKPTSPVLIALDEGATAAELAGALRSAEGAKEVVCILAGGIEAPDGVPAVSIEGVSGELRAAFERGIREAVRPARCIEGGKP